MIKCTNCGSKKINQRSADSKCTDEKTRHYITRRFFTCDKCGSLLIEILDVPYGKPAELIETKVYTKEELEAKQKENNTPVMVDNNQLSLDNYL